MFPGGGGMDGRKMQQMMKQMGIDMQELDAEEVVIRTADEELVFVEPDVQRMDAQGQQTYTIVGEPDVHETAGADDSTGAGGEASSDEAGSAGTEIPDEDVELVAGRAGVSEADAREALEATDGDLAAAIERLE